MMGIEMKLEAMQRVQLLSGIAMLVFWVITVAVFFKLRILSIWDAYTGKKAKHILEEMKAKRNTKEECFLERRVDADSQETVALVNEIEAEKETVALNEMKDEEEQLMVLQHNIVLVHTEKKI